MIEQKTRNEIIDMHQRGKLHGLYKVSDKDYHSLPYVSSSFLKKIVNESMYSAQESMKNPIEVELENDSKNLTALTFGTAFHELVLDPEQFVKNFVYIPRGYDGRTKEGKAFKEEYANHHWINQVDQLKLEGMAYNLNDNEIYQEYKEGGLTEIACFWVDKETRLQCKAKFDLINRDKGILDLKSTRVTDISNDTKLFWEYRDYGYDIQARHYLAGLLATTENTIPHFMFTFVQKTKPFDSRNVSFDEECFTNATPVYMALMAEYKESLENRVFKKASKKPIKFGDLKRDYKN